MPLLYEGRVSIPKPSLFVMTIVTSFLLVAQWAIVCTGFVPSHQQTSQRTRTLLTSGRRRSENEDDFRVVVVGKIILDKYGDPNILDIGDNEVTIGGGGPQAAFGACASLAARDLIRREGDQWKPAMIEKKGGSAPPKQRVTFLAPVGTKNWTPHMSNSLNSLLPMLQYPPILVTSDEHITPTIHIWHDEKEIVNWLPSDGSFGEFGAGGLWRNRPSAEDILDAIEGYEGDVILHAIIESGSVPTGKGMDALPFFDTTLIQRVSSASIEPIVFPDDETGMVSKEDSDAVRSLISRVQDSISACIVEEEQKRKLLIISPDRSCYDGLVSDTGLTLNSKVSFATEFAVRDGANGSTVHGLTIPSATLRTLDGRPVNPTGAGNAYSGAYAACRGSGSSAEEAACLANAAGAVVCEYDNLPPWTWEMIERVAEAACEVWNKVPR